ncbi:MAG: hypothetical protein K1X81_01800 [Bacteroidia bacterium]|nr:hypothetical protein [Bacteroidia bacterium]
MIGYKLTESQKNELLGKPFCSDSYFNPVQDVNGDWFISQSEVDNCSNEGYMWVKQLQSQTYTINIHPAPEKQ